MPSVVLGNPILKSWYAESKLPFRFTDPMISDKVIKGAGTALYRMWNRQFSRM